VIAAPTGATHVVRVDYDHSIEKTVADYFERYMTVTPGHLAVADAELEDAGRGSIIRHGARRTA